MTLRGVTLPNRIVMAPMCQYSAPAEGPLTGSPVDWHVQHYGARAVGGAGLIIVEATGVSPEGRISPFDLGLWSEEQLAGHRRLTTLMTQHGAVPGIQLAHAGRKASTDRPWEGGGPLSPDGLGWEPVGPSPVAFDETSPVPHELTVEEIDGVVAQFVRSAKLALEAGYQVLEIHGAHGYLLHEFLSPDSNRRTDEYGGSFDNRARLLLRVVDQVRAAVPDTTPLLVRVSATDWVEPDGWTADDSVRLSGLLREHGVDVVHVSTGGNLPDVRIPVGPGYQVPFAERIRKEAEVPTAAVGMVTEPEQAEAILAADQADLVALARILLLEPYWPQRAARALGAELAGPDQYARAASVLPRGA